MNCIALQGLFAIVEFGNEEAARKALAHERDIFLRGCRLVVKPQSVGKAVTATGTDTENGPTAKQLAASHHSQLIDKLTSCGTVRT